MVLRMAYSGPCTFVAPKAVHDPASKYNTRHGACTMRTGGGEERLDEDGVAVPEVGRENAAVEKESSA